MSIYPQYFRKGCVCIKRESDTSGKQVEISNLYHFNPPCFKLLTFEDKRSFDRFVKDMDVVEFDTYEEYLISLHQESRHSSSFRENHSVTPEFFELRSSRSFDWQQE